VSADKDRILHDFVHETTAQTVNAFYYWPRNLIAITPGIAQFPLYSNNVPEYITYGRTGSIIAHELTHGLETFGIHFDKYGAIDIDSLMDPESLSRFTDKATCFVDQFSWETISGTSGVPEAVNGTLTVNENIDDAGGVNVASARWQRRAKEDPFRNRVLPGLEQFSNEQLFFLNYANTWCSNDSPGLISHLLQTDSHSPNRVRINANLENSRGFKEAFQCKVKELICELW
jgi:endothelin-converting enzyme